MRGDLLKYRAVNMGKIRLGGIKVFEGRSQVTSSCREGEFVLDEICARLAADRINLNFLTHVAEPGMEWPFTALCTESAEGFPSYFLVKAAHDRCDAVKLLGDVDIVSLFPHDQRADVIGTLIALLAQDGIPPQGLASSPSAISVLISSSDTDRLIESIFGRFEFPAYRSPFDWRAAYHGREHTLREIVCSYQEEIIKVYDIRRQEGLDLWRISVPPERLEDFGNAMISLGSPEIRMPFMVGQFDQDESLIFAFCFAAPHCDEVAQMLASRLSGLDAERHHAVAVLSLVGPHFGDRYGIVSALAGALKRADVTPLAMSCAVSTISFIVPASRLEETFSSLSNRFETASPSKSC